LRRALVGPAILVAVLGIASPAHANPFPNNYNLSVADNDLHTYCYTDTFVTDPSVADYAMAVLGNTTDMTDELMIDPPFCGLFRGNDVWWWEEDLPAGTRGERSCELVNVPGKCASSDVRLDFAELDIGTFDWEDRRKTGVHEVGHSVGLGDGNGAMITGEIPDATLQWRTYTAHDIGHINTQY